MSTLPSQRRVTVPYFLIQICLIGMMGTFCGYETAILLGRGFSNGAIGAFIAVSYLSGILVQPLLGSWADRHPDVPIKRIFGVCTLLNAGVQVVFYFARPGFAGTAAIFILLGILEFNVYPLVDAMVMQFTDAGLTVPYSLGRGLGAVSYGIFTVLTGILAKDFGVETALLIHGGLLAGLLVCISLFPCFPAELLRPAEERITPHSALHILRTNRPFALMLCGGFFTMVAIMPLGTFLVNVVEDRGGDSVGLGVALFLMSIFELPGALIFQWLRPRMKSDRIMLLSLIFSALKPLAYLAARSLPALLLVQPVQIFGYGIFMPASVYFANDNVAPEDRVQGQMLKMVITCGLGAAVGNLMAGGVAGRWGADAMLWVMAFSAAIGVLLGAWAVRLRGKTARPNGSAQHTN